MGDYTPLHKPGHAITFTASAAVKGQDQVEVTGDWQVGPAAAGSTKVVGQAGHDADAGSLVTVHTPGRPVHVALAAGAVTAGDHLQVAADQKVATGELSFGATIGLALSSAADGEAVDYQAF